MNRFSIDDGHLSKSLDEPQIGTARGTKQYGSIEQQQNSCGVSQFDKSLIEASQMQHTSVGDKTNVYRRRSETTETDSKWESSKPMSAETRKHL
jgi:hypothetical protein